MNNSTNSSKKKSVASDSEDQKKTKRTLAAALTEKRRRRATESLIKFVLATMPGYRAGWFHEELATTLEQFLADVAAGKSPRLIVMCPPRHGKSELVSIRFPAYALGRHPDLKIISVSHTAELAEHFSREVQTVIDSETYAAIYPDTRITGRFRGHAKAPRQVDLFQIIGRQGTYRATGVKGSITGLGADILIIDDPVKDDEAANSEQERNSVWNWFRSTAYTRLNPGGGAIMVSTRWHPDDLVGCLLNEEKDGGEKWRVFKFSAIAEEDEPHRRAGEALCPERYSVEDLKRIRRVQGSYRWHALYQQNPVAPEGAIIKPEWIRYYREVPHTFEQIVISCDCSFKGSASSDYVAMHLWAKQGADFYLLDRIHDQMGFAATCNALKALGAKWPQALPVLVEEAANGSAVIDELGRHLPGIVGVRPEGNKLSRVHSVSSLFEAGNVFLPHPSIAPWVHAVADEITAFPNARHDDDVDAMTQALRRLLTNQFCPFLFGARDGSHQRAVPTQYDCEEEARRVARAKAKVIDGIPLADEDENSILFEGVKFGDSEGV